MADNTNLASRRAFVKYSAGLTAGTFLAGCTGNGDDGGDDSSGDSNNGGTTSNYPEKTLRYIVPFGPGGGTDTWARQLIPAQADALGQQVEIENIEGSDSLRGTYELYQADPDGYTFGAFNPPSTPTTYLIHEDDMNFDITDLQGVGIYSSTAAGLFVNSDVAEEHDIQNAEDILRVYQDGTFDTIGSRLAGSYYHIRALLLKDRGVEWSNYVGYDGNGALIEAIAKGEVPIGLGADTAAMSATSAGRIEPVTILHSAGSPVYPDTTPITDHGMDEMDFIGRSERAQWVPPGVDDSKIQVLTESLKEGLESDRVQDWADETGNPINYEPPEVADETLQRQIEEIRENVDLEAIREAAEEQG